MSALDDMTGLLGVTVAAGVVTSVADHFFPRPAAPQKTRASRKSQTKKAKKSTYRLTGLPPGNFSNVGF